MANLEEYTGVGWENEPSTKTPINARNLGIMEDGIKRLFKHIALIQDSTLTDEDAVQLLAETGFITAVEDSEGNILTDGNGNYIVTE